MNIAGVKEQTPPHSGHDTGIKGSLKTWQRNRRSPVRILSRSVQVGLIQVVDDRGIVTGVKGEIYRRPSTEVWGRGAFWGRYDSRWGFHVAMQYWQTACTPLHAFSSHVPGCRSTHPSSLSLFLIARIVVRLNRICRPATTPFYWCWYCCSPPYPYGARWI